MSEINKFMFREYDIRGRVDLGELNEEKAELIGKGFGTYLIRKGLKELVIGYDSRSYSEGIKNAAVKGLLSTGCDVIDVGMCITPVLYFSQYHFNTKAGCMVTASHNPNGWSGFKLADGFSRTLRAEQIRSVYDFIVNDDFESGKGSVRSGNPREAYAEDVLKRINIKKSLKVVVECGNGTAGIFAPDIIRKSGCEVVELHCNLDPTFPHYNPNPELKEVKEVLSKKVREVGADIGISFDGDGDRMGVTDNEGNNIWSDRIMILLSRQLLEKRPGSKIVFDVKCTKALEEEIKRAGGIPVMWKTGHAWIKEKAHEIGALLAGERSGHIFISDEYYGFDDAIFASLKLIEFISSNEKSLSEIIKTTPQYFITPTIHVPCPDDKKYSVVESLTKDFKKNYKVIDINGARVVFGGGWGLVRASSNEPVLVVVVEAETQEKLEEYKNLIKEKLDKYPAVSKEWENE